MWSSYYLDFIFRTFILYFVYRFHRSVVRLRSGIILKISDHEQIFFFQNLYKAVKNCLNLSRTNSKFSCKYWRFPSYCNWATNELYEKKYFTASLFYIQTFNNCIEDKLQQINDKVTYTHTDYLYKTEPHIQTEIITVLLQQ